MPRPLHAAFVLAALQSSLPVSAQAPDPALRLYGEMIGTNTYLVDTNGAVVHTWPSSQWPGLGVYLDTDGTLLRTITTGAPLGTTGGSGGGLQRLALDGTVLWDFRYDQNGVWSHHDIEPLPNGNVLLLAWEDKTPAEAVAAGRDPGTVFTVFRPDHLIEVQPTGPTSGAIVWEWHAFDHLVQDFDPTQAHFGVVADHPELVDVNYPPFGLASDWNHCNGIDYDPVHDWVVISCRNNSEIWIIDHSTTTAEAAGHAGGNHGKGGDLLYRWGNPAAYQRGSVANQMLFNQHSANFIPAGYPGGGNVLLFNNNRPGGSAAQEIVLPLDPAGRFVLPAGGVFGPAAPVWSYRNGTWSVITSSARRARNGNTLVCYGQQGRLVEVTPSQQQVWSASLPANIFHAHYVEHYLWTDRETLSLTPGGSVQLDLIAGSEAGGDFYLVLGSVSGTAPGTTLGGQLLPLNPDGYFDTMASQPNVFPFGATLGTLGPTGRARASITLPPGLTALAGLHLDHAFVAFDPVTLQVSRASNAVPLDLVR